jgi:hypothetical protein
MASETSVVTPERFATGMTTFAQWMDAIENRKPEFQRHYDEYEPNADDIAAIKGMVEEHGVKALVLGEDWCPDVWRGLPVISKVAEQTGMELRLFLRDQNKDIMSEFLNQGEFESIPTIVFYDRNHRYLGHWIERPVRANDEMEPLRGILAGVERDTPAWDEARARYNEETWKLAPNWRHAEVTEIRALLEEALA